MILTCPQCAKRYLVDENTNKQSRVVRCASCKFSWTQEFLLSSIEAVAPENKNFSGVDSYPIKKKRKRFLGLALFILTILIITITLLLIRKPISENWPTTTRFFTRIGMPVEFPGIGLSLENVHLEQGGQSMLHAMAIQGEVVNKSSQVLHVPTIHITIYGKCMNISWISRLISRLRNNKPKDPNHCILASWSLDLSENRLFPNERTLFITQSKDLVVNSTDITVNF
jgi:predicted Zn finger-like uncharacterized protein